MTELLIGDIFRRAARVVPDAVAAALGDDSLTFGEIDQRANATARALVDLGVARGDRVVVWSDTTLDLVVLFAALAKHGAVFAPMGPHLSAGEAAAIIDVAGARVVIVDGAHRDAAHEFGVRVVQLRELVADADTTDYFDATQHEDDLHVLFFTSGSTGRPKAAALSHRVNFVRTHAGGLAERRGPLVCMFPLFHMAGWTMGLQQWQTREPIVFVQPPEPAALCAAVERHRATRLYCIPAVWHRIFDYLDALPADARPDLSSLRRTDTGTSATPPELLAALRTTFPDAEVRVFYGSTEAGAVATLEHVDIDRKPGSCGQPVPLCEARLAADGELLVRGPLVFSGYFGDAAATDGTFTDGWFRTGDLAEIDDDGFVTIVGRVRDVIRTGGETVAPVEVEHALLSHNAIDDVAVIGLPDSQWGEIVCAVVVARDGTTITLDDVRAHCASLLAPPKHPRRLVTVDGIPRTASTGQVQRRLLVERFSAPT